MKLMIAIPTVDTVPVEFLESLTKLVSHLKDDRVQFDIKIENGTLVYLAREKLARVALIEKYTHILWLDSDMVFEPELLEDLQFCGKSFVTGIAHSRRKPYSSCLFKEVTPNVVRWTLEEYPKDAFKVAACGMAACLMETKIPSAVLDKFGCMFIPTNNFGEDVAFCWRATECGFDVWAEPAVRGGHVGKVVIYPEDER